MITTDNLALTVRWRALYSIGLLLGVLTAGYGTGGWIGAATGSMPSKFAIPLVVLLGWAVGRLVWVWRRPGVLTWPTTTSLRKLAKIALYASAVGIVGVLLLTGSGFLIKTVASDARGAAGLIVGLAFLPLIALAPLGLVVFEWTRGWAARATVPAEDRDLLTIAAISGALLAIAPTASNALFPSDSLTRSQYADVLPWIIVALGLGAPVVRGLRGSKYPVSAVFSTTLAAYVVAMPAAYILSILPGIQHGPGRIVDGAGFALVLAVGPAGALAILHHLGANRSASWIPRALMAVPLVLTVAWLGVSTGTRALRAPSAHLDEFTMTDEQLSRQAKHLQRRCHEAGTQIIRTASDVTQLEIRYPDGPQRVMRQDQLRIHPDSSRPHHWFPMQDRLPAYELVVFNRNGKRFAYGPDATQSHGYGRKESKDIQPRYLLTWKNLETPEEAADGVVGDEMTVVDTQSNDVLARRVLFFKRTNDHYGMFREACGTLSKQESIADAYAFKWVSSIVAPRAKPSGA